MEGNLRDLTTQVSELIHQITASVRTFVPTQLVRFAPHSSDRRPPSAETGDAPIAKV